MASTITTGVGDWASGRRGDARFLEVGRLFFVPRLLWVVAAFTTLLLPNPRHGLLMIAVMSVVWTVVLVQRRGGPFLTPSGVYFMAGGVFVGVAAWYLLQVEATSTPMADLRVAAVYAFVLTVLTELVTACYCIRWRVRWTVPTREEATRFDFRPPRQFALRGFALLAISRLPFVFALNYDLSNAIGLAGVLILLLNAASMRRQIRWLGDMVIVAASVVMPALWMSFVFEGGGRLTVAGLGIAVLMAWNLIRGSGWQKVAAVLAVPVFLLAAGINRVEKIERDYGVTAESTSVFKGGEGLISVYDPLDKFGFIMTDPTYVSGKSIGPRFGATFANTLMMPIPRSSWEGKPKGFGAELTELIAPHMVSKGQSYAALFYTEWYANFGLAGFAMAPLVVGWFLARLDRAHARLAASRLATGPDWWQAVVLLCVVSSLGDLYWSGTHTFFSRGGMAALIAWAVGGFSMRRLRTPVNADDASGVPADRSAVRVGQARPEHPVDPPEVATPSTPALS